MSEWQPIETAPKDWTDVIVGSAGSTETDEEPWAAEAYFNVEQDGWWLANTNWTDSYDGRVYPTHWMPLPAPPEPTP